MRRYSTPRYGGEALAYVQAQAKGQREPHNMGFLNSPSPTHEGFMALSITRTTQILLCSTVLFMSACNPTPRTIMKNEETGEIVNCGGQNPMALGGGIIGYSIMKSQDNDCVTGHQSQGFVIISQEKELKASPSK